MAPSGSSISNPDEGFRPTPPNGHAQGWRRAGWSVGARVSVSGARS